MTRAQVQRKSFQGELLDTLSILEDAGLIGTTKLELVAAFSKKRGEKSKIVGYNVQLGFRVDEGGVKTLQRVLPSKGAA